eukprot:ANDGO_07680.mRNA.1 hypothetical protein
MTTIVFTYVASSLGFIVSCFVGLWLSTMDARQARATINGAVSQLSAYAALNPDGRAIPGTFTADDYDRFVRGKPRSGASAGAGDAKAAEIAKVLARRRNPPPNVDLRAPRHEHASGSGSGLENVLDERGEPTRLRQKPNDPCACASGMKYKRCCALVDREIIPDYY